MIPLGLDLVGAARETAARIHNRCLLLYAFFQVSDLALHVLVRRFSSVISGPGEIGVRVDLWASGIVRSGLMLLCQYLGHLGRVERCRRVLPRMLQSLLQPHNFPLFQ